MPIGEIVGEVVGQFAMEAGGDAIHRRWGWKGCVVTLVVVIGAFAALIWLVTR